MTPRIGVVGLGQRGLQHLAALARLQAAGEVRIASICDVLPANLDAEKLRSFVPDLDLATTRRTTEFAEICEPSVCDALFISIPPSLHKDEVVRAARAGLHLMVEKPMSLEIVQALEMERAIQESGVLACCGFQQRYEPRHEAVHAYVSRRKPVFATYAFHASMEFHNVKHTDTAALGGPANRVWAASQSWSGGIVVEGGIHPLDLWRYWFGEVNWVQAAYVPRSAEEVEDLADNPYAYSVQFGFQSGVVGNLTLSRVDQVSNVLTDHRVFCSGSQVEIRQDLVSAHEGGSEGSSSIWSDSAEDGTYAFAAAFARAVSEGDETRLKSPFADGMRSLACVLAANASHERDGERVHIEDFLTAGRMRMHSGEPRPT